MGLYVLGILILKSIRSSCFHHLKNINPFPNKPWFLHVCLTNLLKTLWEKEKLLVTSNFSFDHSVFYLFRELSTIFIKFDIFVCIFFQVWKSLKFVVQERVECVMHLCNLFIGIYQNKLWLYYEGDMFINYKCFVL